MIAYFTGDRTGHTMVHHTLAIHWARVIEMLNAAERAAELVRHPELTHPENYRGLLVRVAGFTQYWVELGKPIQDEIIARTEYENIG